MPDDSWVKVSRSVDRMIWRSNPNIVTVWLWILTHVNEQDRWYYGGGKIPAGKGQVVTTMRVIGEACGVSFEGVRHALRVLTATEQTKVERIGNCIRISVNQGKNATTDLTTDQTTDRATDRATYPTTDLEGGVEPTTTPPYGASQEYPTTDLTTDLTTDFTTDLFPDLATDQPFPYISRRNQEDIKNTSTLSLSPSLQEVERYFRERGYRRDPSQFYSYNAMRGWGRIRDWRAAADLWESHGDANPTQKDTEESSSIDWDSVHQMVLEVPTFRKGDKK